MMILRISRVCEESRRFADDMSVSEEGEGEEEDDGVNTFCVSSRFRLFLRRR